jgi:hypothetical protein
MLVGRRDERRPLGRPTHRWEDNIKMNLPQVGWEGRMHLSCSGLGQMAGSCEWGNEPSFLMKCGEFVDLLRTCLASQGGLWSMELVS